MPPRARDRPGIPRATPNPTSRKLRVRMFARCGELFIQARIMLRGLDVRPSPKPMFSPYTYARAPAR